jgi:transitional endoplasmic reticulum ATPase
MSDYVDISPKALIARVCSKREDGCRIYYELKTGGGGHITSSYGEQLSPEVGDTLLLWPNESRFEIAPPALWPEQPSTQTQDSVAVVRLKVHDLTVIDQGGKWKIIETTTSPEYTEGNTVMLSPEDRIVRVLSSKPLRWVEVGSASDVSVERFKVKAAEITEKFEDFGGMGHVVARAKKLIELPLKRSEQLRKIGARPIKGILFSGPPGTGKTMLARIIAGQASAAFYKVSGPEVLSKWYGESEAVLRAIFDDAAKQDQAIVFFDEIDSVAARRTDRLHEASQKLVAQLLALMDGFEPSRKIVVVAATNRPETLDPALRRPGRFDWEVEFTLPNNEARRSILESSGRGLSTASCLPYDAIVLETDGWTPAELAAIWTEAALLAADDERDLILEEDYLEGFRRVREQRRQKGASGV